MRYFNSSVCFLIAAVAIYLGMTGENFYPGRLGRTTTTAKPVPKWFGRAWFLTFAGIAIYMGIRSIR
jgi:hypothetical protein